MKNLNLLLLLVLTVTLTMFSCSKDQVNNKSAIDQLSEQNEFHTLGLTGEDLESHMEKLTEFRAIHGEAEAVVSSRGPISYNGQLCPDISEVDDAVPYSYPNYNLDAMDYWSFYGVAGSNVIVNVERVSCGMDPIAWVYEGTAGTSEGVSALTYVTSSDDYNYPACSYCYGDPYMNFLLPSTGYYTVRVADYFSCESDLSYKITVSGNICDSDGDGCNDDVDPHPDSNMDATVVIDGCDSGVANTFPVGCSTMSDLIADCADSASNHGEFTSCVSALTNAWKDAGLISGAQKGAIQSCAGGANLP